MAINYNIPKIPGPWLNANINNNYYPYRHWGPPIRILFLSEGVWLDNMTFQDEEVATKYLIEYLHKKEQQCCKTLEDMKEFRKAYGIHLFELVEA